MSSLHTHENFGILFDFGRRGRGVHVRNIVSFPWLSFIPLPTIFSIARIRTRARSITVALKSSKVFQPATRVHDGGGAVRQYVVGYDGRCPSFQIDMCVQIDEARRDVVILDVDGEAGFAGRNIGRDPHDPVARDGDISKLVNAVRRIDHMSALQDKIVTLRPGGAHYKQQQPSRVSHYPYSLSPIEPRSAPSISRWENPARASGTIEPNHETSIFGGAVRFCRHRRRERKPKSSFRAATPTSPAGRSFSRSTAPDVTGPKAKAAADPR